MRTKKLWLNILPTLDAILNANSLTDAADRAHLSQPALSIALRKARAHFEDELIVFSNNGSTLTEFGYGLRGRVKAALETAREALDYELQFTPESSTRTVRIMANSFLEMVYLPKLVKLLLSCAPGIDVVIEPFKPLPKNPNLLEDVDVVIASSVFAYEQYNSVKLFSDQIKGLACQRNDKVDDTVAMSDWYNMKHAFAASFKEDEEVVSWAQEMNKIGLYAPSANSLPYMIIGTGLVLTVMEKYSQIYTQHLPLRTVDLVQDQNSFDASEIHIHALWKPHRDNEPFMEWLIGKCIEAGHLV